jgi:aldehyde:ferredoxin oxidoreductase
MKIFTLLRIDLHDHHVKKEVVPHDRVQKFIGGKGLAAHYLYNELESGIDPLSPENKLIFMIGPLTGIYPGFPRYTVVTKSPLTGTFTDSYSGGAWPVELRKAGYIGIILENKSENLVYIQIDDDSVGLKDASHLQGKDTAYTDQALEGYHVAAIGKAGENLVKFACIMNDMGEKSGRSGAAGRGGVGAVMGSKNVKAIAIRASAPWVVPDTIQSVRKEYVKRLLADQDLKNWTRVGGNLPLIDLINEAQILPTENFRKGTFDKFECINEEAFGQRMIKKQACPRCPVPCGTLMEADEGLFKGSRVQEIEYETVTMCGSNCGQGDIGTVIHIADLCDKHGLDTISTGSVIAFAMECSEKNMIDYAIKFGDSQKQVKLLHMIIHRKGVGDTLAEGVMRAAEILGGEEWAVQVKGMEIPAYDPRGSVGMSLAYATADRGGCHMRAWTIGDEALGEMGGFSLEGKAALVKKYQDLNAALWCLINCDNIMNPDRFFIKDAVTMLKSIGIHITEHDFSAVGERVYNLTRQFNVREGFSRTDDILPARFTEPRQDTGWYIKNEDFTTLLEEYYQLRGWDENGIPTSKTLNRLNLG